MEKYYVKWQANQYKYADDRYILRLNVKSTVFIQAANDWNVNIIEILNRVVGSQAPFVTCARQGSDLRNRYFGFFVENNVIDLIPFLM